MEAEEDERRGCEVVEKNLFSPYKKGNGDNLLANLKWKILYFTQMNFQSERSDSTVRQIHSSDSFYRRREDSLSCI